MTEIEKREEAPAVVIHGEFTSSGWHAPAQLSFKDWQETGQALTGIYRASKLARGDWLRYGENRYGEKYAQGIELTNMSEATLKGEVYVASAWPIEERTFNLSFSHYRETAPIARDSLDEARDWMAAAQSGEWTRETLRDNLKRSANGDPPDPEYCKRCGAHERYWKPERVVTNGV